MYIIKEPIVINYDQNTSLSIDTNIDSVYLKLVDTCENVFTLEDENNPNVLLDYDSAGELVGIELMYGKDLFPVDRLTNPGSNLCILLEKVNSQLRTLWE